MMRSLWTAASGMIGQQTALDVTANNLSNINTTGYKTQTTNFKSLIYQNLQRKSTTTTGEPKPVGAQVGLGTRVGSISSDFHQGAFGESHGEFDFAIQGEGFFSVRLADGSTAYTRNGHFLMAVAMGYFYSRYAFGPYEERRLNFTLALIVPILLHGLFDFFLMASSVVIYGSGALLLLFGGLYVFMVARGRRNYERLLAYDESRLDASRLPEPDEQDEIA